MTETTKRIIGTQTKYINYEEDNYTPEEHYELCCGDPDAKGLQCGKSGKKVAWVGKEHQEHWPQSTKDLIEKLDKEQAEYNALMQPYNQALSAYNVALTAYNKKWKDTDPDDRPPPPNKPPRPNIDIPDVYKFIPRENPCGEIWYKWTDPPNCCGLPPEIPLAFTETPLNPLAWNEQYRFCVEGGFPPYTWGSQGKGLSISGSSSCAILSISDCFCEPGQVICEDSCGYQVSFEVVSEEGYWELDEDDDGSAYKGVTPTGYNSIDGYIYQTDTVKVTQKIYLGLGGSFTYTDCIGDSADCPYTPDAYPGSFCSGRETTHNGETVKSYDEYGILEYSLDTEDWFADSCTWIGKPASRYSSGCLTGTSRCGTFVGPMLYAKAKVYKWKCGEWDELVYDDENSAEVINDDSSAAIMWEGGKPPFRIAVTGQGFYMDYQHTTKEYLQESRVAFIYTANSCGICEITIQDACDEIVQGSIRSAEGRWENDPEFPLYGTCPEGGPWHSSLWEFRESEYAYHTLYISAEQRLLESDGRRMAGGSYCQPGEYPDYYTTCLGGDCNYRSCIGGKCAWLIENGYGTTGGMTVYGPISDSTGCESCCGYYGINDSGNYCEVAGQAFFNGHYLQNWVC